jgi:HAD superfamily hydrolase (TIGR01549 family)
MDMRAPAGIGFDLDHTLAIDNKLERVAFLRLLEAVCADGGRPLGSLADETDRIDALLALQRSGAFSIDDAVHRFVLERGVPAREVYAQRYRAMAMDMVDEFVIPMPDAAGTYAALRERGIPVVILSNGWNPLQVLKAQRAGFEGPVIASADIGCQKPARKAFDALLAALGTAPDATWYVGDDPYGDVGGALQAGLIAVWMDNERKIYPGDAPAPSMTVQSLEELVSLLPAVSRGMR